MLRYSASTQHGHAIGLAPCLTPDFIRSFIFGTNGAGHQSSLTPAATVEKPQST
jgi:hypothetical protein